MRRTLRWLAATLITLLLAEQALAQVYVAPRRPGKSVVRYFDQDWRYLDLLDGEVINGREAGGIRFFYYEQQEEGAMRAAASIEASYLHLAEVFDHTPRRRFSYILYDTYQEFLATNLFPLQEGVLGVTSPRTLEVTLPYFGDHARFEHVSVHELVHEFTIQKVQARADEEGTRRDPLNLMPLWFIEGLAEYYAHDGIDDETEMLIRDMVTNPDLFRGYGLIDFFFDAPGAFLYTYKLGQIRVAFLEEVYGEGTVQEILERSPRLVEADFGFGARRAPSFRQLVGEVVDERPTAVSEAFEAWLKRRVFPDWLDSTQDRRDLRTLRGVRGIPNALASSPDGNLLMYRTLEPFTGRSRLMLLDRRNPRSQHRVIMDRRPGAESLHPIEGRNFALGDDRLVYIASSRDSDVLHWGEITHRAREVEDPPPNWEHEEEDDFWRVRLRTHNWERFPLRDHGLVAAFSPSLSPDGEQLAFIASRRGGTKNLYVLDREGALTQLTDDEFAQRETAWSPRGVVYTSDATDHGLHNVFLADPTGRQPPRRLTTEASEHWSPVALPDGRIFFVAWTGGHANLHEITDDGVVQRTDVPTGLFDPGVGPDGGLWSVLYESAHRGPVEVPSESLVDLETREQPEGEPAEPLPTLDLADSEPYRPLQLQHWRPDQLFGFVGAGAGAIYGQVFASASDQLRDHTVVLSALMFGSLRLTDGFAAYMNQAGRVSVGAGAFQSLRFRIDRTFDDPDLLFQSNERFFGGLGSIRYPFNRFSYLQLEQRVGGAEFFLFDPGYAFLQRQGLLSDWRAENDGIRFQTETIARFGMDTIQYHAFAGPIAGWSLLAEVTAGAQPLEEEIFGNLRFDAEYYVPLPLVEGANVGWRASAGSALPTRYSRSFFLSSYDTLRGVRFGDVDHLLGDHFVFTKAELRVPLDFLIRTAVASTIQGVVGVDFGGVADELTDLWDRRILDVAVGGNIGLGPLVLRIHFARALDIGADLPDYDSPWVPNISLSYMQF